MIQLSPVSGGLKASALWEAVYPTFTPAPNGGFFKVFVATALVESTGSTVCICAAIPIVRRLLPATDFVIFRDRDSVVGKRNAKK